MSATTITAALTLLLIVGWVWAQDAEQVETTLGPVQGLRKAVQGMEVDVYYGIPFAKPPLGPLRFKHPVSAEPWSEVMEAVNPPNSCLQSLDYAFDRFSGVEMWNPNTPVSEDCLYINVWVPRGYGSEPPKTTMVWIYGGGFYAETSTLDVYDAATLAATQNVIVASFNYRLGAMGFLYTATEDAPGNQGLMDQVMALRWIWENVGNFGGHQDSITIFGESAGAVSVGFHLLSPLSMNYFSRSIMQSGSPTADWAVMANDVAVSRANTLSGLMDCDLPTVGESVECLQSVDAQNLTDTMWYLLTPGYYFEVPLGPIVDGYFLPQHPRQLLKDGAVKTTDVIVGANKDEGMYWLLYAFPDDFPLNNSGSISKSGFKELVHSLNFNGKEVKDNAIIYEYVDSVLPDKRDSYRDIADDISGDDLFICPSLEFATSYAALGDNHNVYLYSFEHRLSNNPWPAWTGVMHGYEIEGVFGLPLPFNYSEAEEELATRMSGYWVHFAENGYPNGSNETSWPRMASAETTYLKITAEGDSVQQGLRYQQCSFRSTVLPLLGHGTHCHTANDSASGGQ